MELSFLFAGAESGGRDLVAPFVLSVFLFVFTTDFDDFPHCTNTGGVLGLATVLELARLLGALSLWLAEPFCTLEFLLEVSPGTPDFEPALGLPGATLFGRGLGMRLLAATPVGSFFLAPGCGDELWGCCRADPLLAALLG